MLWIWIVATAWLPIFALFLCRIQGMVAFIRLPNFSLQQHNAACEDNQKYLESASPSETKPVPAVWDPREKFKRVLGKITVFC